MSKDQIIYYYDKCPLCGAEVNGKVCPQCGGSLVKSVENVDFSDFGDVDTFESALNSDEANLPIIKSNCGKPSMFNIIFGGVFFVVGCTVMLSFIPLFKADPDARKMAVFLVLFMSIFIIIGAVPLIIEIKRAIRTNKVNLYGQYIVGEVRGYQKTNVTVNGKPELALRILVHNPDKKIIVINTHSTKKIYEQNQSINLKHLGDDYLLQK